MPTLTGIDHVHVYVPSRDKAAKWFESTLGFKVSKQYRVWAAGGGPLTIQNETGSIHLALFKREDFIPSTAIAFGADADNFLAWKTMLEANGILSRCTDHKLAWSLYFHDLYENMYEITTYDYAAISVALES